MYRHTVYGILALVLATLTGVLSTAAQPAAQTMSEQARLRAVGVVQALKPELGNPVRWEYEVLIDTDDDALRCPLAPGVQAAVVRTPFRVSLFYNGEPEAYIVHVASNAGIAIPCDPKLTDTSPMGGVVITSVAPDACTLAPANGQFFNVRLQPNDEAPLVLALNAPISRYALGRNGDGTWLLVQEGWIAANVASTTGDCVRLSVRDDLIADANYWAALRGEVLLGEVAPAQAINAICPPDFAGFLPPRLRTGEALARVAPGGIPNKLRQAPSVNAAQVGTVQPGRTLDFVWTGPQCSDGYVWWEVEVDGVRGWTAESGSEEEGYFLEPVGLAVPTEVASVPAQALSAQVAAAPMTADSVVNGLAPLFTPQNLPVAATTFAADGTLILGTRNDQGSALLLVSQAESSVRQLSIADAAPVAVAVNADATLVAVAYGDGRILIETPQIPGGIVIPNDMRLIQGIAFDPGTNDLAVVGTVDEGSASPAPFLRIWDLSGLTAGGAAAVVRNVRYPYQVQDVAYNADGEYLAVLGYSDDSSTGALWVYNTATNEETLVQALTPNTGSGAFLLGADFMPGEFSYMTAAGLAVLDVATSTERVLLPAAPEPVIDIAFAPDGLLWAILKPGALTLYRDTEGSTLQSISTLPDIRGEALAFSPMGNMLAVVNTEAGTTQVFTAAP